jgi:DNA-binding transcriptional LysR family regulator
MSRHLPLSALRVFEAVTRTGSFRAAGADLALTPGAVSHAIRGLERTIGMALFVREGRSVRLTAEGETLMRHVDRGFGELQLGIASISTREGRMLRLHSAPSFAAQWLMPRLPRLIREARMEVRIAAGTDYTRFLADEFDADIVYGLPTQAFYGLAQRQSVVILPLGSETVTPLCVPALVRRIDSARSLLTQPLIESEQKRVRWGAWFAANGLLAPQPHGLRFDRSFLSLRAAADGLGVALESTRLAERELASGQLVRPLAGVCEDVVYTGHWLVFPRAARFSTAITTFISWISKELDLAADLSSLHMELPDPGRIGNAETGARNGTEPAARKQRGKDSRNSSK